MVVARVLYTKSVAQRRGGSISTCCCTAASLYPWLHVALATSVSPASLLKDFGKIIEKEHNNGPRHNALGLCWHVCGVRWRAGGVQQGEESSSVKLNRCGRMLVGKEKKREEKLEFTAGIVQGLVYGPTRGLKWRPKACKRQRRGLLVVLTWSGA